MGLFISVLLGLQIFAMGNVFQCFIDIEENTERTVRLLRDFTSNPIFREASARATGTEESSSSIFTYLCPNCPTFSRSDVISCPNCGTANPHHPANKSKAVGSQTPLSTTQASDTNRCLRCGAGMSVDDKFCSSCGHPHG
jgi:hypothetical protein